MAHMHHCTQKQGTAFLCLGSCDPYPEVMHVVLWEMALLYTTDMGLKRVKSSHFMLLWYFASGSDSSYKSEKP